jgi:hypothetical protein
MRFPVPNNPDALLTRKATASALTEVGYPVAEKTLATKATRGGGPPFRKFGPRSLYRWGDSLDWARSRLSPPIHSTSEADVVAVRVAEWAGDSTRGQPRAGILTGPQQHTTTFAKKPLDTSPTVRRPRSRGGEVTGHGRKGKPASGLEDRGTG